MPEPSGYASGEYASAIADGRSTRALARCAGTIVVNEIAGTDQRDAIGPYPLFCCEHWERLADDLDALRDELVSVAMVIDPLGGWTTALLDDCFAGHLIPFKEHFVVELGADPLSHLRSHHRRNVARGRRETDVERVDDLAGFAAEWSELYAVLSQRHAITGEAAFSRRSLAAQLAVPGMVAFRARHDGETIGAILFYVQGARAYYHLGAYRPAGYERRAAFALFALALETFAGQGLSWACLGGGAGGQEPGDEDGLTRFKRGWATTTRTAWFGGRVLSPETYSALSRGRDTGAWFPAYRSGAAS